MDIKKILTSMREKIDPNFNFVDNTDQKIPFHNLEKRISESKIALISSGGFHLKEDKPFDTEDSKGDPTYRMIPKEAPIESIEISHSHYNHKYVNKDINCGFPIELLKELDQKEAIGSLADKNYSFMGYCLKVEKLKENARELADKLKNEEVEAALIAPA